MAAVPYHSDIATCSSRSSASCSPLSMPDSMWASRGVTGVVPPLLVDEERSHHHSGGHCTNQ